MKSAIDRSVNWPIKKGKGLLETRFVRRADDYIIAYLSSHNGCKMGCKMCWLTAQGQTRFNHCSHDDYVNQFKTVIEYYREQTESEKQPPANKVHVNFMAKGEPLANKTILNGFSPLFLSINEISKEVGLTTRMNISTIMPYTMQHRSLVDVINSAAENTHIYYSMYSVNPNFRKKWIPNAMDYHLALDKIKEYQEFSGQPITLHWAFIKGENDDDLDIMRLAQVVKSYDLIGKFNIVRYNPPPGVKENEEPNEEELANILEYLQDSITDPDSRSKIVPRVGKDVYASCGMFMPE